LPVEKKAIAGDQRLKAGRAGSPDFLQCLSCATPDALAGWRGPDTSE
jgi:hypothetical protein